MGTIDMIDADYQYRRWHSAGTGRTTAMLKKAVGMLKSGKLSNPDGCSVNPDTKTIAILVPSLIPAQAMMRMLKQEMERREVEYVKHATFVLRVGDLYVYVTTPESATKNMAGIHPYALRFIDHAVEEELISQGLGKIKRDLVHLRRGW